MRGQVDLALPRRRRTVVAVANSSDSTTGERGQQNHRSGQTERDRDSAPRHAPFSKIYAVWFLCYFAKASRTSIVGICAVTRFRVARIFARIGTRRHWFPLKGSSQERCASRLRRYGIGAFRSGEVDGHRQTKSFAPQIDILANQKLEDRITVPADDQHCRAL